ncbi:MAG: hypothetical protein ACD_9C00338G0003 [uncultured bacterium]|nr:MAG: hypothetical protein ACD_9C00338G0003 [uncultured bacterium]
MIHIINIAHAGVITDAPSISSMGIKFLFFLLSIAMIIAIIALVISGILYFFSGGDEKKMQIAKRSATYAILGVALAMGGMILVNFIGQFFIK